ncbi:conserved protein of unknown function (plasmid) [Cupriavidus taiwanensis]|uniref:Uncharacterized protein n=1 Tax=Cupriavidus taiwanensis TaxID=164546 RepID=A0A375EC13_9BURK|nr:conserved protein of unknown function [Cupriavidus taiwanensis]SOZ72360.1 conserved protein of unknown function [Cupriavidus taiwanensis]SOZ74676.1 conserved protein of unknown function [Cupriavidus taiwanensis]SPA03565.1 conserved protein of unknown function [Cupriavidus taiwanensis]SPA11464.1 conserved protein of unknown function [Cupriavidus taiwanensis]
MPASELSDALKQVRELLQRLLDREHRSAPPENAKRVYRVMRVHGRLLQPPRNQAGMRVKSR